MIDQIVYYPLGDNPPQARLMYGQDVRSSLKSLPDESVQMVATSPPYWGLRDYGGDPTVWGGDPECPHEWGDVGPGRHPWQVEQTKWKTAEAAGKGQRAGSGQFCRHCDAWFGQLGLEPTHQLYVAHMVEIFQEIRRILRPDGIVWLNLGDSYVHTHQGQTGVSTSPAFNDPGDAYRTQTAVRREHTIPTDLKPKDLVGIPWRVAFGLQEDGWWLRSDVIWCLSGGAWVYAQTQKGEMPVMVRDLADLHPSTVKLWNGEKWTQLLGMSQSKRRGNELEIVLRSGERISCTPNHQWPTSRGLLAADELLVGDVLQTTVLPEPGHPRDSAHIGVDAAWCVGWFLADGSWLKNTMCFAGHPHDETRFERLQKIVDSYGGRAYRTEAGDIHVEGAVLAALFRQLLTKYDGLNAIVWQYSNAFLDSLLDGYLQMWWQRSTINQQPPCWSVCAPRSTVLERDLRTICARLGYTLSFTSLKKNPMEKPMFEGFLCKRCPSKRSEIKEIRKSRCREVYDLGVADDPHLFALASGVLTHNSKGNPLPESVRDRPTKAHEYVFLLAKSQTYFYDAEAIRENSEMKPQNRLTNGRGEKDSGYSDHRRPPGVTESVGRNKRTVWNVNPKPYPGSHFAVWPEELVEPMIKAGTSQHGCCSSCGAPWQRTTEVVGEVKQKWGTNDKTADAQLGVQIGGTEMPGLRHGIIKVRETTGWEPTCQCGTDEVVPCTVLDPFSGSATTGAVAMRLGRSYIGTDIQQKYFPLAQARLEGRQAPQAGEETEDLIGDLFG